MILSLHVYTAFSKTPQGGNLAGIVVPPSPLNPQEMQKIASLANYSETVFIQPFDKKSFSFRYFTPRVEVEACGHATLAGLTYLKDSGQLAIPTGIFETAGGKFPYTVNTDIGSIFFQMPSPILGSFLDSEEIIDSLGITSDNLMSDLPIQRVCCGLWDIIIPVKSRHVLMTLTPKMDHIQKISTLHKATGYHVFAPGDSVYTAFCRNFSPAVRIPEEAATGTASCALSAYLYAHCSDCPSSFLFRQGDALNRPSEIFVTMKQKNNDAITYHVGGYACFLKNEHHHSNLSMSG